MNTIVAVAKHFAIGYKGDLLIRISTDLKRFRALTTGKVVVMGYNTFLSMPGSCPLKNRTNIVLYPGELEIEGATVVHDIPSLLAETAKYPSQDVFVIGGGMVYKQMLAYCDTAYITKIDREFEADTYFPDLDAMSDWAVAEEGETMTEPDGTAYRYVTYKRV